MDSLKTLAFYSTTTPETKSGLSILQKACLVGDEFTARDIFVFSPSVLDTMIALSTSLQHKRKVLGDVVPPGTYPLNYVGHELSSPLIHLAARVGTASHIRRLNAHGADVNEEFRGSTPLHLAAEYNCLEVVKELVSRGAILSAKDCDGFTAAHVACWRGKTDIVLYFLEQNIKEPFCPPYLTTKTCEGYFNYLHLAVLGGHKNTVAALIDRAYDVNCPSKGCLPRSVAQRFLGDVPYDNLFKGSDSWEENSPLMISALTGSTAVCLLLVDKGANLFYHNLRGESSITCATKAGHFDIAEFLRSKVNNLQYHPT